MSAEMNFDANSVKPNAKPDPVPNGKYRVMITSSEVKPTANGKGKMLSLELVILDGDHKGRKLWDRLNIQHESKQAQDIAQGQLSAICHAVSVLQLKNSSQLHNRPLVAKVIAKQDPGFDAKNEIKGYEAAEGTAAEPVAGAPVNTQPAASPTVAQNAPAWARKTA